MQEIRQWFDSPLALSGSISTGDAVLAAQAIVDRGSDDIVYSNIFTSVHW